MYKEVEKMTNSKKMNPQKLKDMLLKYALYIILLLLLVVIVAIKPNFLSVGNLISILKQASTKGILAYGVAGIIILAGTDLSVGRVLGLCAAVAASMLQSVTFASRYYPSITEPLPLILPFLVCVAIAVIISAFNGFGMAKLHMHPFIVTLGTQLISYGLCCIYIENQPSGSTQALSSLDQRYLALATGSVDIFGFKLPYLVIIFLLLGMVMDTGPAIVILAPVLLPAVQALGVDEVHFGVILVCCLSIGLATPPFGLDLFVAGNLCMDICAGLLDPRLRERGLR